MKKVLANIIVFGLLAGIVIWIGLFLYGIIHAISEDSKSYPGKPQFEVANQKIFIFKDTVSFGNSTEATALASAFSARLQQKCKETFTGGSKLTPATAGNFLTYCRLTPADFVILCQVPDLRGYDGDVRDTLAKLAWETAQEIAKTKNLGPNVSVVTGLRGFASYGPVWEGKPDGDANTKGDGPDEVKRLYPYFLDATDGH